MYHFADSSYQMSQLAQQQHASYLTSGEPDLGQVYRAYEMALDNMTSKIAASLTTYDHYSLMLSIGLLFLVYSVFILVHLKLNGKVSFILDT